MAPKTCVLTSDAPAPMPILSQGVICNGMVYVSGSLGIDPKTGKFVDGTVADRTVSKMYHTILFLFSTKELTILMKHQIFRNMSAILKAAGSGLEDMVSSDL